MNCQLPMGVFGGLHPFMGVFYCPISQYTHVLFYAASSGFPVRKNSSSSDKVMVSDDGVLDSCLGNTLITYYLQF